MANEFKKPTTWDVTTGMTNPTYAYDAGNTSTSSGDTSTAANFTVTGTTTAAVTRTSIASAWASPGQTYTSAQLKMRITATLSDTWNYDDAGGSITISYALDGTNYTQWWAWDSSSAGSGPFTQGPFDLTPVSVTQAQISTLKVKVVITGNKGTKVHICRFDDVCTYDGMVSTASGTATVDIFDIYTDGVYTTVSISGLSKTNPIAGEGVTITGTGFTGATSITIGGAAPYSWSVTNDTTATVWPNSGQSGTVTITTPSGSATSASSLTTATAGAYVVAIPATTITAGHTSGAMTHGVSNAYNQAGNYSCSAGSVSPNSYVGAGISVYWTAPSTPGGYSVTVTSIYGGTSASWGFNVVAAATGSITGPANTTVNQSYLVTPTFANGTAVLGTTQGASDIATGITSGANYSRTAPATPGSQTTWMRVTNTAGDFIDASFTTSVWAAPTAAINASTTNPLWGAPNVTVTPVGGGDVYQIYIGTSVYGSQISGNATNNVAVGVQTGGFTTATTYYSTVFNHALAYVGSTGVTITPQTPALTPITPANSTITTANGETKTYVSTASGIYNTAITWWVDGVQGGNATVGTIDATGHYTPGTALGSHTIAARLVNGTQVTTLISVYAIPTVSLGASSTSPLYGASVNLTPTFANDADNLAQIGTTQGGNQVSNAAVSGNAYAVTPLTATTYWARVINGAGLAVDSSILVTPQTVTMSAISPANPYATVQTGTITFSTTVSNAVNTGKDWYVDNIAGGNATVGTINASGVYIPGTQTGAHTIKAVSQADGTKSVTTQVNVFAAPSITSFTVSPNPQLINQNFNVTASWTTTGSDGAYVGSYAGGNDYNDAVVNGTPFAMQTGIPQVLDLWLTVYNYPGGATVSQHITETIVTSFASGGGKRSACASSC